MRSHWCVIYHGRATRSNSVSALMPPNKSLFWRRLEAANTSTPCRCGSGFPIICVIILRCCQGQVCKILSKYQICSISTVNACTADVLGTLKQGLHSSSLKAELEGFIKDTFLVITSPNGLTVWFSRKYVLICASCTFTPSSPLFKRIKCNKPGPLSDL